MKQLTLTIVIPVYNEESYLDACLKSIQDQTELPDEVIIVDNNSTDRSVAIAKQYPFVTVLHEQTQGVQATRNTGFNAADSDIIGRIDADTCLLPNWVKQVKKNFEDKTLAAVSGPTGWYDMPLKSINHLADEAFKTPVSKFSKNFHYLFGANMALRATAWKAVRSNVCTRQDITEDHDLSIHLADKDLKIRYNRNLLVRVSSRRIDDSPLHYYKYLWALPRTYRIHHIKTFSPWVAMVGYSLGYFNLQWFRYAVDPKTQECTLKSILIGSLMYQRHPSRKDPMSK